ncbi:baseplate assembly protein [Achromobacter sp. Root83]|uniref:phage baseplate assembly protein V n=1 Tax=Achromobacter sp. Root83 TaxID=1736602 RepID=UPI00070B5D03|nr:phage baseplate assembly protein V [Achromobacter sp. Root83]KRC85443.1 baseplate assembly protein [Achromobacter sp. Root83]
MNDAAELFRLISNLVRIGTVSAVDLKARPAKVRVASGDLQTNWLPWLELRAGRTRTWNPPTLGEQVVVLCPDGDPAGGVVLAGLNSDDIPAPSDSEAEHVTDYPDGARITYDHQAGKLTAVGVTSAFVEASESATVKCPEITLDGNVTVTGLFTYQAGMAGKNGKGNGTTIQGDITHVSGNLSSNGVVLHTHKHRTQGLDALTTEPTK